MELAEMIGVSYQRRNLSMMSSQRRKKAPGLFRKIKDKNTKKALFKILEEIRD